MKNENPENLDLEDLTGSIQQNAFANTRSTENLVANFDRAEKRRGVFIHTKDTHLNGNEIGGIQPIRRRRTEKPINGKLKAENSIQLPDREGTTEIRQDLNTTEPLKTKEGLKEFYHKLNKLNEFADQIEGTPDEKMLENILQTVKTFTPEEMEVLNKRLKKTKTEVQNIDPLLESLRKKRGGNKVKKIDEVEPDLTEIKDPESELDGIKISVKPGSFRVIPSRELKNALNSKPVIERPESERQEIIPNETEGETPPRVLETVIEESTQSELDISLAKLREKRSLKKGTPEIAPLVTKPEAKEINRGSIQTKVVSEIKRKPLKTAYEAALGRIADKEKNPPQEKHSSIEFNMRAKDNKEMFSDKEEVVEVGEKIKKVESFEELIKVVELVEGIQGSQKWFSKNSLLGRLHLVQVGEMTLDQIPLEGGLREKVKKLIKKEEQNMYTPAKMEVPEGSTKPFSKEPLEKAALVGEASPEKSEPNENEIRKNIREIFEKRMEEQGKMLDEAGRSYAQQLGKKMRHDANQGKISKLMNSLLGIFGKKTQERKPYEDQNILNIEEGKYKAALELFKRSIDDTKTGELALLAAKTLGDKGLEIIEEEKREFKEKIIIPVLVMKKKNFQETMMNSFSEKDKNIIKKIEKIPRNLSFIKRLQTEIKYDNR